MAQLGDESSSGRWNTQLHSMRSIVDLSGRVEHLELLVDREAVLPQEPGKRSMVGAGGWRLAISFHSSHPRAQAGGA